MELLIVLMVTTSITALISWAWIVDSEPRRLENMDREYGYQEEYLGDD